jgi:hypothetical protein
MMHAGGWAHDVELAMIFWSLGGKCAYMSVKWGIFLLDLFAVVEGW